MPSVGEPAAVNPEVLSDSAQRWRRMIRIDSASGSVGDVIKATNDYLPDCLVYAEGDSWFDKFTPLGEAGTNLLDTLRTPFLTAVVDVAHIGEEARDMVRGHQARQTQAMFKLFSFQAILLSAGGNDLKNIIADRFAARALAEQGVASPFQPRDLGGHTDAIDELVRNIGRFVDLRDAAGDARTRRAPIFVHGYDYLQPRPAGAQIFAGSRIGGGPWLYPSLRAAGLDDAEMRAAADAVIDELNVQLARVIATLPNVHLIDQRGLLEPAAPGTTAADGDWLDEIHPNKAGFTKLARNCWDVPVSLALGWQPGAGELVPPLPRPNPSRAAKASA